MGNASIQVILFVEGETDKEFYETLISYYKNKSNKQIKNVQIINIKGISRYETKVPSKLKNEIIPKFSGKRLIVFCSYDTDVFELAQKPPVNWENVKNKVLELDVSSFYEIKAQLMIEDWFLKDLQGICNFLKIKVPKKVEGKSGNDKMKWLFKKGRKIYQKGANCHKFVPFLDIEKIRNEVGLDLKSFENILGVNIQVRTKTKVI